MWLDDSPIDEEGLWKEAKEFFLHGQVVLKKRKAEGSTNLP